MTTTQSSDEQLRTLESNASGKRHGELRHERVRIGNHTVDVTEDDIGVVELHEE